MTTVTWPGKAGHRYTFTRFDEGYPFPDVAGVYILCNVLDGHLNPLYIGETESFRNRLVAGRASHEGYARADKYGVTHVCLMGSVNALQRKSVETELRHVYNPPCNDEPVPRAS